MNVFEMSDEQLWELAKRYEIDAPRTMKRKELEDAIQVAVEKRRMALEDKARSERQKDLEKLLNIDPASKTKPSPETISISESPKVYVLFTNLEEEGVDVPFNWGCTHTFHLWHDYLHVMPKCVVDRLRDPSDPCGKRPQYGRRPHPSHPDIEYDCVVGHKRRFGLEVQEGTPPKNSSFGVILDGKIYEKLGVPFPQPVAHST